MSGYSRIRRQQLVQEAEGYIDLVMCLSDKWALSDDYRSTLAKRSLRVLDLLDDCQSDHPRVLYLRGQAYRLMHRYRDAIAPLQRASELDPDNMHVNLALGWCFKRIGRIDSAIQALEEAIELYNNEGILHYNLACYWSLARNLGLALSHLSIAFDLEPSYREMAQYEEDFDALRDHPEFMILTGAIA
ncbi:MAG: tetratricopeptide repeat protein [Planctomycetales bacterium]|nr:tetratricopeptide repeat protein [Planctomycetales bacterium]